jgi:prophage maintenance system killer protein
MTLFLEQNGTTRESPEEEAYQTMMTVAAGGMKKPALAAWLRSTAKRAHR